VESESTDAKVIELTVDGKATTVPDDGSSLLGVLRDHLAIRSPKDGCSPQGQCGCCTVLVDGQPRVACVTPARRVRGREITTVDGLEPSVRDGWADAFTSCGASQCGFCTPGIIMRLEGLRSKGVEPGDTAAAEQALLAHLCRCTGWRTIIDAWGTRGSDTAPAVQDRSKAAHRASIEGRNRQQVGPEVAVGNGGFADDTTPEGSLVALPDGAGGWAVGESLDEARTEAGKVQGRRTTTALLHPLELPPGDWDVTLRTTWVEPGYLETDASWCEPGGLPATPLANGGAFGGKMASPAPAAARELADRYGRPVRVLLSREDTVRFGPKRPPIAAGVTADGTGKVRVVRTPGIVEAMAVVAPGLQVEEVAVPGPPTSADLRAAGWAEAMILGVAAAAQAAGEETVEITSPEGATARATVVPGADPRVEVAVRCGEPLDVTVLRSYCVGAAHMALGWVTSEGLSVSADGEVQDLTIRSFGILRAVDTPPISVEVDTADPRPPVNGSDAVFAAVAAATWLAQGLPGEWPSRIAVRR
jgi:aerobic-type carbon monoxide dehydrogenase small subunit (CoxS/CutS family)